MILCLYVGVKHVISCFIYSCFLCLLGCRAGDRQPVRVRESHAKYQTLLGRPTEGKFDSLSLQLWYYLMVMLSVHGVIYLKYCSMLHWGFLFFAFKIKTSISIILPLIHYTECKCTINMFSLPGRLQRQDHLQQPLPRLWCPPQHM